jgi:hypothetical protein
MPGVQHPRLVWALFEETAIAFVMPGDHRRLALPSVRCMGIIDGGHILDIDGFGTSRCLEVRSLMSRGHRNFGGATESMQVTHRAAGSG